MREYQLFGYTRAVEAGLLEPVEHSAYDKHLYVFHLVEIVDGKPARILGTDGGEPEDQSFGRDWNWVVEEMNRAYHYGYEHGREVQYEAMQTLSQFMKENLAL